MYVNFKTHSLIQNICSLLQELSMNESQNPTKRSRRIEMYFLLNKLHDYAFLLAIGLRTEWMNEWMNGVLNFAIYKDRCKLNLSEQVDIFIERRGGMT